MLNHPTHDKLHQLRLAGMAKALAQQDQHAEIGQLTFEERLGLLVDAELAERESRQNGARLKRAKLRQAATPEDIDFRHPRGLDRALFARLMTGRWVADHQNVLLCGPTGVGKTWLACALGQQACRQGFSVLSQRVPRLTESLRIAHADGSFGKLLTQLARTDVLLLDDWGMTPLDQAGRHDLLEVIDDRSSTRSTIITSQLPIEHWHAWLNDPTVADAILDRLVHRAHRIALKGESLRRKTQEKSKTATPS